MLSKLFALALEVVTNMPVSGCPSPSNETIHMFRHTEPGIDCLGSSNCFPPDYSNHGAAIPVIWQLLNHLPNNFVLHDNNPIVCAHDNICVFMLGKWDKAAGITRQKLIELVERLHDNDCEVCGSNPLYYPKSNDLGRGFLTINYVDSPACVAETLCGGFD